MAFLRLPPAGLMASLMASLNVSSLVADKTHDTARQFHVTRPKALHKSCFSSEAACGGPVQTATVPTYYGPVPVRRAGQIAPDLRARRRRGPVRRHEILRPRFR